MYTSLSLCIYIYIYIYIYTHVYVVVSRLFVTTARIETLNGCVTFVRGWGAKDKLPRSPKNHAGPWAPSF